MKYTGNLTITKENTDFYTYKGLTSVGGDLRIHADVKLDALTSVGGDLRIYADAELNALTSVGGYLYIDADVKLDALTSVGGYLYIDADVKLDALTSVGGSLCIFADASVELDALTSVDGNLRIYADVKLDALTSVGGNLHINADAALTTLTTLNALTSVGGYALPTKEVAEANLRKIAPIALEGDNLDMSDWHCGTSHCLAGWAQFELLGIANYTTVSIDGTRLLGLEATGYFHASNKEARAFLEQYI